MGVLFDYFIATDDGAAAAIIDRDGGPGALPTVADAGFDPLVQATTLEELLTGQAYDDISDQIGWGRVVASREGGERTVVVVSSGLVDALALADDTTLAAAMVPWVGTEEFWGAADPDQLLPVVRDLAGLSREAKRTNQTVYCWTCV